MRINSLRLIDFRNYQDYKMDVEAAITVFGDANGTGKTNILEGIYLATMGKSHRTSEDSDMIRFNQEIASVAIEFIKSDVPHELVAKLPRQGRKIFTLNANQIQLKELIGTLNTVFFSPEDLQIIKGTPQMRRRFLDVEISQTSKTYYQQLLLYKKALRQRNQVLKQYYNQKNAPLDEWDEQLATIGAYLIRKRLKSLEKMTLLANLMHRKLTDGKENLKLRYTQPYSEERYLTTKEELLAALSANREIDRKRLTTSVGPHRDDFNFLTNFGDLKHFGSQGQQRTATLALKLSELEFIKSEVGEYPILLLDDVISELDEERRKNLIGYIHRRVQTFVTTTDLTDFKDMKDVEIIMLGENNEARK